jgi:hypothetical protein
MVSLGALVALTFALLGTDATAKGTGAFIGLLLAALGTAMAVAYVRRG